jgi:hypothetical protein
MPAADPQAAAEIWNLEEDRLGVQRAVADAQTTSWSGQVTAVSPGSAYPVSITIRLKATRTTWGPQRTGKCRNLVI